MSTRCSLIVRDSYGDSLAFYRHSDGYPSGVAQSLGEFLKLIREGKIRDNVTQACGWLIVIGYDEYKDLPGHGNLDALRADSEPTLSGWKVGAWEPTAEISGDIDYLYELDLVSKMLRGWRYDGGKGDEVTDELELEIEQLFPTPKKKGHNGHTHHNGEMLVRVNGYGKAPAKTARELRVGEYTIWDFGYTGEIVSVAPKGRTRLEFHLKGRDGRLCRKTVKADRLMPYSEQHIR